MYDEIYMAIFSIFNSEEWKALEPPVQVFPNGVDTSGEEFVVVDVLPSSRGANKVSVSGVLLFEIFVQGGRGPRRLAILSDIIDRHVSKITVPIANGKVVQTFSSTLANIRTDADSAMLRGTLTTPFNYFSIEA